MQNIPIEILTPEFFGPRCSYFCACLAVSGRRGVGRFFFFLIDMFCVSLLLTITQICRASPALVLDVPHSTRSRMGVVKDVQCQHGWLKALILMYGFSSCHDRRRKCNSHH